MYTCITIDITCRYNNIGGSIITPKYNLLIYH